MNQTPSTSNKQKSQAKRQEKTEPARSSERKTVSGKEEGDIWNFKINEVNTHDRRFVRNKIRTTKYTWLTFIPKNLFEQFSKMANVYFLFIMVL